MKKIKRVEGFKDFTSRLEILIKKNPKLIVDTLSNVFTMRIIGTKTHGDLAEIAITQFINQYMYDFRSKHVGRELSRNKEQEEDIQIKNEITQKEFPVSLKAYGVGALQLSTDKNFRMFPLLEQTGEDIVGIQKIRSVFEDSAFSDFRAIHVLSLIYDEKNSCFNILIFDYSRAEKETAKIVKIKKNGNRKHPVFRFYNSDNGYICEVRYGDGAANPLQRGLWTHTKNGSSYFRSLTNGWIGYSHNEILVKLLSHALVSSDVGHREALQKIKEDIARIKRNSKI